MYLRVFIDLKKAFDTINHEILLKKWNDYSVRGVAQDWIRSYLHKRQQYVAYNGVISAKANIECGIPQGSILGPILFILYVNDLYRLSEKLSFILFADDTNMFYSDCNLKCTFKVINEKLTVLNKWFMINKYINLSTLNWITAVKSGAIHSHPG